MPNRTVEFIEPTANDITEIVHVYSGGVLQRVDVYGDVRIVGGGVERMSASIDRDGAVAARPAFVTASEGTTDDGAILLRNQNGF